MAVKTETFPINYFNSIWAPLRAFARRHQLSWPGMAVVLLFLNALLTIPVTLNYAGMDNFPLEQVYPQAMQMVKEQSLEPLQQAEYRNGHMIITEPFSLEDSNGIVAGGLPEEEAVQILENDTAVLFEEEHVVIKEDSLPLSTIPYTQDFTLENVETGEEAVDELSRQWIIQNQVFVVLFFSFLISAFLFVMQVFLVLGAAVFLYLTKKSTLTSIYTYKESVNLLLNALGLPTLAAMLLGLVQFDIVWMLLVQTIGLLIMLLVVYFKTHFNDDEMNTVTQE